MTNAVDLSRLRAPGSLVREALLPAPMLRVSAEIFQNFSIEAYYQAYWNRVELDPTGSYFSFNDLTGRAAEGFFLDQDPGSSGLKPEQLFTTGLSGEQLAAQGFPVEPITTAITTPTGQGALYDNFINAANGEHPCYC